MTRKRKKLMKLAQSTGVQRNDFPIWLDNNIFIKSCHSYNNAIILMRVMIKIRQCVYNKIYNFNEESNND